MKLAALYNKMSQHGAGNGTVNEGGNTKDGKYMFSIGNSNHFKVEFDFGPWLIGSGVSLPNWASAGSMTKPAVLRTPYGSNITNFIAEDRDKVNRQYIDNLHLLVQSVSIPGLGLEGSNVEIQNDFGKAIVPPKGSIIPASNDITIKFLNTEYSVFEYMIHPWLREVQSTIWIYRQVPFSRANIKISFMNQLNTEAIHSYIFYDCYPTGFETLDLTQEASEDLTRDATFSFDYMTIDLHTVTGKPTE